MRKTKQQQIIEQYHKGIPITQGKDGRWRTYVKDESKPTGRRQIAKKSKQDLLNAVEAHYKEVYCLDETGMTLESLLDDWIVYKRKHVERTTVERIQRDWNRYYTDREIISIPIKRITKLMLDEFIHDMIQEYSMNKHQFANFSLIIKQMLDYAVDRDIIKHNPYYEVRIDKRRVLEREEKKADNTQVFSVEELDSMIQLAWSDFYSKHYPKHQLVPLALAFMFYTGLRIGEVCAIRYEDYNEQTAELTIKRMVRTDGEVVSKTKGTYGERIIPLVPKAVELIEAAKERQNEEGTPNNGYIFSMTADTVYRSSLHKAFYRYCDRLGILRRSSHKARKTFISACLDQGININTVRQFAGHVDERTTLSNYCFNRKSNSEIKSQLQQALA